MGDEGGRSCAADVAKEVMKLQAENVDGIVIDLFRVCTTNFEPVSDLDIRKRFLKVYESILRAETYEPDKYLKRKANFLKPRSDSGIQVPVRAYVSNDLHPTCTTIEIQALDRIGLLHDLFSTINAHGLTTAHARICTEKGVAMDTLYITTADGKKTTDPELLETLETEISRLIELSETA